MTSESSPVEMLAATEQVAELAETFVQLTDTLIEDFDVIEVLDRLVQVCVDLLGATSAALILNRPNSSPAVVAASDHRAELLDLVQLQRDDGPCVDCLRTGDVVLGPRLEDQRQRWPTFVPHALALGYRSASAFPLRLRGETLGGLNLFHVDPDPITGDDHRIAQALADAATVGILQQRTVAQSIAVTQQLQHALDSRTLIEQAKGMLAEYASLTPEESFVLLRRYCRNRNEKLTDTARRIAERTLAPGQVLGEVAGPSGR